MKNNLARTRDTRRLRPPLILPAQTRQADRDKAHSEADAMHREELHRISDQRQQDLHKQSYLLVEMLEQNNKLTEQVSSLLDRTSH